MAVDKDSKTLYSLIQMIESDKESESVLKLLATHIKDYGTTRMYGKSFLNITLTNGIMMFIANQGEHYILSLKPEDYVLDDNVHTKMSSDRLMWYIRHLITGEKFPEDDE